MLDLEEVKIESFFFSSQMPYGMRVKHLPTGLEVVGNCKNETSQNSMQRTLLDALAMSVQKNMTDEQRALKQPMGLQMANESLQAQLVAMQEQIRELIAKKDQPKERKKPGRKPKAKASTPAGEKTEEQLIAEQMRPPSDPPMQMQHIQSRGSTVAKSNVNWIKE